LRLDWHRNDGFLAGHAKESYAGNGRGDGADNPAVDGGLGFFHKSAALLDEVALEVQADDWGKGVYHGHSTNGGTAFLVAVTVRDVVSHEVLARVRVNDRSDAFVGEVVFLVVGAAKRNGAELGSGRGGDGLGLGEANSGTIGSLHVSEPNFANALGNSVHVAPSFVGDELVVGVGRDLV